MSSPSHLILPDGRIHELFGTCTLGRHATNDLSLANDHVSRQHAIIQWQQVRENQGGGGFLLIDLGSSNGTYVNGRRVAKPVPLKDGDVIDLSGSRIEFHTEDVAMDEYSTSIGSTMIFTNTRKIWLLVADIVGSTRMAQQLSPEEVPRINGNWFKSCREIVESHGGHMNQYLGDGFFCYWEDTLEAKIRLPEALRRFAEFQLKASPPFRVVLHFGVAVLGSVPTLSSLNLHGANVNFVFRMEKLAGSLGEPILLSRAASIELGLAIRSSHEGELSGYDGIYQFDVPKLDL